jgi:hypothetical protein
MTREGSVDLWTLFVDDAFGQSVTADTDILATDITLSTPKRFKVVASYTFEVSFTASGVFYFVIKKDGVEYPVKTNDGIARGANAGGTYNITLTEGYSLNIRFSASTTLNYLTITGHGGKI